MKKVINLVFNDFTHDIRVLKISRSLQSHGYDVTLVATHFEKSLPKEEIKEDFKIRRFNVGRIKILPFNLILFWLVVIKNFRKEKVFHCNDLYTLPPAYLIKKIFNKNAKIVYDCHEYETEAAIYIRKPIIKKLAKIFEKNMIIAADRVFGVSPWVAKEYQKIYGIKPIILFNAPRFFSSKKPDLFRKDLGIPEDKIIFLFQGGFLDGRGIDDLLEVFSSLERKNSQLVLVFLVYGKGLKILKERIGNMKNVYWHEKVSPLVFMEYVASADWGIYLMKNISINHNLTLPNKLFDYILGGLPIVSSKIKAMSSFVEENGVGYTVDSRDLKSIVSLLETFDKRTKKKFVPNLKKVAKEYCWEEQEKVLISEYNALT